MVIISHIFSSRHRPWLLPDYSPGSYRLASRRGTRGEDSILVSNVCSFGPGFLSTLAPGAWATSPGSHEISFRSPWLLALPWTSSPKAQWLVWCSRLWRPHWVGAEWSPGAWRSFKLVQLGVFSRDSAGIRKCSRFSSLESTRLTRVAPVHGRWWSGLAEGAPFPPSAFLFLPLLLTSPKAEGPWLLPMFFPAACR